MSDRIPVETLADLETLDSAEVTEGYRDGLDGEPEPGDNRSRSYWHGWRNGMMDSHRRTIDAAAQKLVAEYVARNRNQPTPRRRQMSDETPYYSEAELALIRYHRKVAMEKARAVVKAAGVTIDPRIAKARANPTQGNTP